VETEIFETLKHHKSDIKKETINIPNHNNFVIM